MRADAARTAAAAALLLLAAAACEGDGEELRVGVLSDPVADVLEEGAAPLLEEEGYDVTIERLGARDLGLHLRDGDLEAVVYDPDEDIDHWAQASGVEIERVAAAPTVPVAVFSLQHDDIDEPGERSWIAMGREDLVARITPLLAQEGLVQYDPEVDPREEGVGAEVTDNPHDIGIEVGQHAGINPPLLREHDYAVERTDRVLREGITMDDAVAVEDVAEEHRTAVVVRAEDADAGFAEDLAGVLASEEFAEFMEDDPAAEGFVLP